MTAPTLPTADEVMAWCRAQPLDYAIGLARDTQSGPHVAYMQAHHPGWTFSTDCSFDPDDPDDFWLLLCGRAGEKHSLRLPRENAVLEVIFNAARPLDAESDVADQEVTIAEFLFMANNVL